LGKHLYLLCCLLQLLIPRCKRVLQCLVFLLERAILSDDGLDVGYFFSEVVLQFGDLFGLGFELLLYSGLVGIEEFQLGDQLRGCL
jgi:hypothetical protein